MAGDLKLAYAQFEELETFARFGARLDETPQDHRALDVASAPASNRRNARQVDKPTITVSKATAQMELAGFDESRQKPDEAKKLYEQVQKENPQTEAASLAQRKAAALKQ